MIEIGDVTVITIASKNEKLFLRYFKKYSLIAIKLNPIKIQ